MTDDALISVALGHIRAAERALVDWQNQPPAGYTMVTPHRAAEVMATIGVCTHIERPPYSDHIPEVIDAVRTLRVKRLRCRVYKDNTAQREAFERITTETGARFVSNLGPGKPGQGPTATEMIGWVETFAPGVITALEGPNEPNLSGDPDWAVNAQEWMIEVADAQRASALEWVRALPLLAPALGKREGYEELGEVPDATRGNLHIYQGGQPADARLDQGIEDGAIVTGDAPVYVTETGYHDALENTNTHRPTSREAQAVYVPNIALEATLRSEVRATYIYELVDEGGDQTDQEECFGLLTTDYTPKPSFTALADLATAVADDGPQDFRLTPVAVKGDGPEDLATLLLEHSDGRLLVCLWRRVAVWDPDTKQPITVAPEPVSVTFADAVLCDGTVYGGGQPITGALAEELAIWSVNT